MPRKPSSLVQNAAAAVPVALLLPLVAVLAAAVRSLVAEVRADTERQLLGATVRYQRVVIRGAPDPITDTPVPTAGDAEPREAQVVSATPRAECQLEGLGALQTFYPGEGACPAVRIPADLPKFGVAWSGTTDDLRRKGTDLAAALEAVAFAVAALGVTPLVVARIMGAC